MTDAVLSPDFAEDRIIAVSASGTQVITKGDWVIFSARWAIPATDATIGSPAYKVSAAGIALENHPSYDDQGVAYNKSGFAVLRRGLIRMSGANSGTAGTIPIGSHVYPDTSASGIVGQTGATGVGPIWATAAPRGISANPTGAIASGVGVLVGVPKAGDATATQYDIVFNLATNVGYF